MKNPVLLFIVLSFASLIAKADSYPVDNGRLPALKGYLQRMSLESIVNSEPVADQCMSLIDQRYVDSNPKDSAASFALGVAPAIGALRLQEYQTKREVIVSYWDQFGLVPLKESQLIAMTLTLQAIHLYPDARLSDVQDYFEKQPSPFLVNTQRGRFQINWFLNDEDATQDSSYVNQLEDHALEYAACAKMHPSSVQDCQSALSYLKQQTRLKRINGGLSVIFPNTWYDILSSTKFSEGLRLAGAKVLSRVSGDISAKSNLYEDLLSSFVESGLSRSDAEDATWKSLLIMSNGSGNTVSRLGMFNFPQEQNYVFSALSIIPSALTYIDLIKKEKNWSMYSLPPVATGACLSSKWYHFWVYAYMARYWWRNNMRPISRPPQPT